MAPARIWVALMGVLLASFAGLPNAHAADGPPYPVSYNFLDNSFTYGYLPSAPGMNIWTCEPSAAHPNPVVLVHGTAGSAAGNWGTLSAVLANNGYCVFAPTYGLVAELGGNVPIGGLTRMEDSAEEVKDFVERVRAATGAAKVDIVGHSQGTLVPNYYAKFLGGGPYIDRYVSLSPVWHGVGPTSLFGQLQTYGAAYGFDAAQVLPYAGFAPELAPDSPFMTKMREGDVAVPGITYTNIVTKYDQLVVPYTSGIEEGMTNIVLQDVCAQDYSDHVQIPSSPNAVGLVLNALDPAHAQPVSCHRVLPANGFGSTPMTFGPDTINQRPPASSGAPAPDRNTAPPSGSSPGVTYHPQSTSAFTCGRRPATVVGTTGSDTIVGTPGDDVIVARGGNDKVRGLGGNDRICGGRGADVLNGGAGTDHCTGGKAKDRAKRCERVRKL